MSDNRFSTKIGLFVCLFVGWLVGLLVGWFVCLFAFREKLRKHDEQFISNIVISLEVQKNYSIRLEVG